MTIGRRVATCPSCGFATDHILHYRNCVPTSQWPRDLRERKAAAMHGSELDVMEIDGKRLYVNAPIEPREYEPEPEKPRGIAEYRRLHPEANPLTTEHMTVREFRQNKDGTTDEWDRVVGVKEAMNQAQPCPRCQRPLLDRAMHITCQPLNGDRIPVPVPRLVRDDVPLTPRKPVIHTTADVRNGPAWYEALPEAEEPPVDADELRDFVGEPGDLSALDSMTPDEAANRYDLTVDTSLAERLAAEQAAWTPEPAIVLAQTVGPNPDADFIRVVTVAPVGESDYAKPFTCPTCQRVSKSAAGDKAHQRSHKDA